MIGRLLSAVLFAALAYALPLFESGALEHDFRPWLAMASSLLLVFAQPTLSKEEAHATRTHDRGSAPLILALSLGSQITASLELRAGTVPSAAAVATGLALVVLGSVVRITAIRTLGEAFTATVQVDAEHRLVDHGIYRRLRHPSYFGAFLALVGVPVLLSAWWAGALSVVLMSFAYTRRIRLAEHALLERHGATYRDYCGRTAMFIPGLWWAAARGLEDIRQPCQARGRA